jgi:hypothetical protein
MKKLEQTIAYFEDAIRESDEILAECSGELQGECKYCKNPSAYLAICQNYETRIFIGISGEYLQIFDEDYPGFCDNHKINFCPICGRKLG